MTFRANGKPRRQPQINGYIGYMGYKYDSCVTLAHNNRGGNSGTQMQILDLQPRPQTPNSKLQFDINGFGFGLLPGGLDSSI